MNICLYGASSPALDRAYFDAAEEFGRLLAKNGHTLVYGGGAQGVMGAEAPFALPRTPDPFHPSATAWSELVRICSANSCCLIGQNHNIN